MKVSVLKETYPGEMRVALAPANVPQLAKIGVDVVVEAGAGAAAGYLDKQYQEKGATLAVDRAAAIADADLIAQVRSVGANPEAGQDDLAAFRSGQMVLGMSDPLGNPAAAAVMAEKGLTSFALELIPRTTRAQSMDVLSSMATIAGYRAVLLAAVELPKMFPMMTTAAGTLRPAKVFILGVGVAGLQAIATAKRLGGVVQAYDLRPACREQVESLGAKFVELNLDTGESEDKGGYAKAMDEAFYQRQRELLADIAAECDVVITTAAIPGRKSPLLITTNAVERMPPGSVVVDLAAERGGNCEVSKADERVVHQGVTILGPTNLPAEVPQHASQMFSNNVTKFLINLIKEGQVNWNMDDEIICETLVTRDREVVHPRLRDMLGLAPLTPPAADAEAAATDTEGKS